MQNNSEIKEFELLCVIVNFGLGSKVIRVGKQNGVCGGTVFMGRGTVKNRFLELLEMTDARKEIAIMLTEKCTVDPVLEALDAKFGLSKPHHGIAFTTPVVSVLGMRHCKCSNDKNERGENPTMYQSIFVVVDKGKAETVIEAATSAGSRGGTIINARGSGIHETSKLFSMDIEPEKEIVLILTESRLTDATTAAIKEKLELDKPGNGIIFVHDVSRTHGVY